MTDKTKLDSFKKMWTWLTCHPAHDREYYVKHVARAERDWVNSCPLSNKKPDSDCSGCASLWTSGSGTLCEDPQSPLNKWAFTKVDYPHDRSYYASQLAVLALKHMRSTGFAQT